MKPSQPFLDRYIKERLSKLVPGRFEGAPDDPSFTVDQRYQPLVDPIG